MAIILVIDDDRDEGRLTQFYLRLLGHRASVAASGPEAILSVLEDSPDLIVSELRVPRLSGLDLLLNMRNGTYGIDVPVVLLTRCRNRDAVFQAVRLGVSGYLIKPTSLWWLTKSIDKALQRRFGRFTGIGRPT